MPEIKQTDPVLYIVMRSDLDSLNPGKGMAQAAHAASAIAERMHVRGGVSIHVKEAYEKWVKATGFYGTTIVLDGWNRESLEAFCEVMKTDTKCGHSFVYGKIVDPTYPLTDGEVTHTFPLLTCVYVFGNKGDLEDLVGEMDLYR